MVCYSGKYQHLNGFIVGSTFLKRHHNGNHSNAGPGASSGTSAARCKIKVISASEKSSDPNFHSQSQATSMRTAALENRPNRHHRISFSQTAGSISQNQSKQSVCRMNQWKVLHGRRTVKIKQLISGSRRRMFGSPPAVN